MCVCVERERGQRERERGQRERGGRERENGGRERERERERERGAERERERGGGERESCLFYPVFNNPVVSRFECLCGNHLYHVK